MVVKYKSDLLDLSTVSNFDLFAGLAILGLQHSVASTVFLSSFALPKTTCLPSKHSVLADCRWKIGNHCVGASISHGQDARTCVLQDEILLIKFLSIDALAIRAIMGCEVTTLHIRKSWNYSVKAGNFMSNLFSPVFRVQKFSAVFETFSANSLREKWPKDLLAMSKTRWGWPWLGSGWDSRQLHLRGPPCIPWTSFLPASTLSLTPSTVHSLQTCQSDYFNIEIRSCGFPA